MRFKLLIFLIFCKKLENNAKMAPFFLICEKIFFCVIFFWKLESIFEYKSNYMLNWNWLYMPFSEDQHNAIVFSNQTQFNSTDQSFNAFFERSIYCIFLHLTVPYFMCGVIHRVLVCTLTRNGGIGVKQTKPKGNLQKKSRNRE